MKEEVNGAGRNKFVPFQGFLGKKILILCENVNFMMKLIKAA